MLLILTLGGALRLSYAFWVPDKPPTWDDSQNYLSIARNVAYDFQYANSFRPPRKIPRFGDIGLTSYREPLYPLFLALVLKLFGDSFRAIFVIQALLGTLAIPLCFGTAALLLSSRAALLAALLESVNPYHISNGARVATENLTGVILLALVFFALRVLRSINAGNSVGRADFVLLFLLMAAGILMRAVFVPVILVTLVFISVAYYHKSGVLALASAARTVGMLALLTAVCVAPWFIRNYLVWNTFVYQTNAGHNLLMGFNDVVTGRYDSDWVHARVLEIDRAVEPLGYNELERDRIFKQEAFKWIRAHPLRAIYLLAKKQLLFWSPMPDTKGYLKLLGIGWEVTLLTLTLIGVVYARGDQFALKYVFAVVLAYSLVHSFPPIFSRYRVPLEGVLAVFAGGGLALVHTYTRTQLHPFRRPWKRNN